MSAVIVRLKPGSLALIGDERARASASPAMHDAIFGAGSYTTIVDDDADVCFQRAEGGLRGVNVTAPHKIRAAARYRDVADDAARRTGAVNTVIYGDDGHAVLASNTDVVGVREAWRRAAVPIAERDVAVIGSGGAARAVVVAARDAGARRVIIHARDRGRGAALVALAASVGIDAALGDLEGPASVVVNAASDLDDVGGWLGRAARPASVVHDLRYGPPARTVRDAALRAGHLFLDGTTMLLAQGLEAARLFGGTDLTDAQRDAARRAMVGALAGR